jgi:hypothetical protein
MQFLIETSAIKCRVYNLNGERMKHSKNWLLNEQFYLLIYKVVYSGENQPLSRRNVFPSSRSNNKPRDYPAWSRQQAKLYAGILLSSFRRPGDAGDMFPLNVILHRVIAQKVQLLITTAAVSSESVKKKLNSVAWFRERTIPTVRPARVGEVSANFRGKRVPRGQRYGSLCPYSRLSRTEPLVFLPSSCTHEDERTPFQLQYMS